ncbi:GSCFA domain-containing protein [Cytophagaceae bacterium DM2B3-1]|uniref:GSCFA domain-containing protein n=1 Tax=Xanthocytophaga flava TaxID=3048013 RepID=A0ABT7CJP8_9BACT|nr:GSCFA domain-containing protein [Xanthocytophaga flavus]MDJ1467890.1 GSCFA domain-containing protein [Xanthocytophaga flavus]MDJ1493968.1 GSCFA domain-containing protein [Xanthocytophaga flavus]
MEFRTNISPLSSPFRLSLQSYVVTIGSCFADVMGTRLYHNKLKVLVNPYGTVFNPISLAQLLELSLNQQTINPDRFVQVQDYWYHYDFHSRLSASTQEELTTKLENAIQQTSSFLKKADFLILTLGTSIIYQLISDQQVVNNCHKVSGQNIFTKRMLSETEILSALENAFSKLVVNNPNLKIILTVSPVRHIKDTLILNSASKSLLRVVCHHLIERFSNISYFPAYEIMMDDLRDYRFYKADMIHPSEVAEEYIWQLFINTYIDKSMLHFLQEWAKITQALSHRPMREQSESYRQFLLNTEEKIRKWESETDVSEELNEISNRIKKLTV